MDASPNPVVSVVIPTYNRAELLPATIASVLHQSGADLEVVVVDDGSTDNTANIVCGIRDPRIVYVRQSNAGRSEARGMGFRVSTGPYVMFLDSDDALLPGALNALAQLLENRAELDWVAGGILFSNERDQLITEHAPWTSYPTVDFPSLVFGCPMVPSSVLMRRRTFAASGGFDKRVETAEDWDLWIRLARDAHPFAWIEAPVCRYRVHTGNSVTNGEQHVSSMIRVLDRVFGAANVPPELEPMRVRAYATAHVRGAVLELAGGQVTDAKRNLELATTLDASWLTDNGQLLFDWLVAGAGSPFVHHPKRFIDAAFANLPDSAAMLRPRWREARGLAAMTTFYRAHKQGRRSQVRGAFLSAVLEDPRWLKNRGAVASWLEAVAGNKTVDALRRVIQAHAPPAALAEN